MASVSVIRGEGRDLARARRLACGSLVAAFVAAGGVFAGAAAASEPPSRPPHQLWREFPLDDRPRGGAPAQRPSQPQTTPTSAVSTARPPVPASSIATGHRGSASTPAEPAAPVSQPASRPTRERSGTGRNGLLLGAFGVAAVVAVVAAGAAMLGRRRLRAAVARVRGRLNVRDRLDTARGSAGDALGELRDRLSDVKDALFDPIGMRAGDARAAVGDRFYDLWAGLADRLVALPDTLRGRAGPRRAAAGPAVDDVHAAFAYSREPVVRPAPHPAAGANEPAVEREVEVDAAAVGTGAAAVAPPPVSRGTVDVIAEALVQAHADRIALSLVAPRASSADAFDRLVSAFDAGATADLAARAVGPYVLVPGVAPKRAAELAAAAVDSGASTSNDFAAGIAGFPRHARTADGLVRLAERAADRAAATSARVCVAELSWRDE